MYDESNISKRREEFMNPWIVILLLGAGVVFLLDYIFRRKKWNGNTKAEKISLLLNMFFVGIYLFASALGLFWGITGCGADTAFGQGLYDVTLVMLGFNWLIALIATIGSFILRKKEKIKASIWVTVASLLYIVTVLTVNSLAGKIL